MHIESPGRSPSLSSYLLGLASPFFALVLGGGSPAVAQDAPDLPKQLDAIAGAEVRAGRSVGIVAKVSKGNETILLGAYGKADAETGEAMFGDTIVSIGSITKQFTAAAILQLRDRGKLEIDDDVTKWLPDFRTHGNKVTLRHLLGHTSGVADMTAMAELRKLRMLRNPDLTRDAIYEVINAQPFLFPTGTMQVYSNTGYWLLGRVIEKASGMKYEDYIERELITPLGLKRTGYGTPADGLPRCSAGHGLRDGAPRRMPRIVHNGTFAAGAIYSTAEDLAAWMAALHKGRVLPPKSYMDMITPTRLNDGSPTRYGMGIVIKEDLHGHPFLGHDSGGFGFSADVRWYSGGEVAVVALTNSEPDAISAVADGLAAASLPTRTAGAFQGDAATLVGKYGGPGRTAGSRMVIEVTKTPEGLVVSIDGAASEPLHWRKGLTFRHDDSMVIFCGSDEKGAAAGVRLDTGGDHFVLTRT